MFGLVRHDNQGCKNQDKHVDDGASEIIVASLRFLFLLLFVKREYVLRYKASMLTIPVGKGTKTNLKLHIETRDVGHALQYMCCLCIDTAQCNY